MNEIDLALKQTGLIVFLILAVLLPFKIKFSENYLIVYIIGVTFGVCVYAGLLFGFDMQPVGEAGSRWASAVSEKIGPGLRTSAEVFGEKTEGLMARLGVNTDKISRKFEPLNNENIQEYAADVYAKIKKEIKFVTKKDDSAAGQALEANTDLGDFINIDPQELMDLSGVEDMIRSLKAKDLYSDEIKEEVEKLKKFILNSESVYPK